MLVQDGRDPLGNRMILKGNKGKTPFGDEPNLTNQRTVKKDVIKAIIVQVAKKAFRMTNGKHLTKSRRSRHNIMNDFSQ